jgi:uncharacterized LabA/DUF88 family protein
MQAVWIVDGAYLLKAAPGKFDFLKLKGELERVNGGPFFESYFLNSIPNSHNDAQDAFHSWLKRAAPFGPRMRVQLYPLKDIQVTCPQCNHPFRRDIQKGVDVGIATLILKLATQQRYDRLILAAGDGDFEDSIDYVKSELHKEVWICGYEGSISADLQSYADKVVWLNECWETIKRTER